MSLPPFLELCGPFQSADSGLFLELSSISYLELSSICYLITGSPPSVPFPSSRTTNILKLDPPSPRSFLQVFCLFPHEFCLSILLLYTWR